MIVCQENVDCERHIKIPFGTYVLSNNDPKPTNKNAPISLDCIYLQATDSAQGGHELLNLQTKSIITRNCVMPTPITPTIINQVQSIADREGMPSGIKISNGTEMYYMIVTELQEWFIQKTMTRKTNLKMNQEIRKTVIRNHQGS